MGALAVGMPREGQPGDECAEAPMTEDVVTIFDKILSQEIPSEKVFEDDVAYAFKDINPTAPVHILVIPKEKNGLNHLSDAQEHHKSKLGHLMWVAAQLGEEMCPGGFRLVCNN